MSRGRLIWPKILPLVTTSVQLRASPHGRGGRDDGSSSELVLQRVKLMGGEGAGCKLGRTASLSESVLAGGGGKLMVVVALTGGSCALPFGPGLTRRVHECQSTGTTKFRENVLNSTAASARARALV